ncbi:hypothetical protein ATCM_03815 [Stenotrophomonas sp. ATCM1_4]|nr:hypothetical protein ATCM_03815 [Stenotrophomonas sp. ATCM1_4]
MDGRVVQILASLQHFRVPEANADGRFTVVTYVVHLYVDPARDTRYFALVVDSVPLPDPDQVVRDGKRLRTGVW